MTREDRDGGSSKIGPADHSISRTRCVRHDIARSHGVRKGRARLLLLGFTDHVHRSRRQRHRDSRSRRVQRSIDERIGSTVLLARHPRVTDLRGREGRTRLPGEFTHVGVLDLPAPAHLLNDKAGIQPHFYIR